MGTLKGKRALVTGSGQGLGLGIVEELLAAGADVAIHYFSSEAGARELKQRAAKNGQRAEILHGDLTNEKDSIELVHRGTHFLGGLDILVNNAGDLVGRRSLARLRGFDLGLDFFAS